MQPDLFDHSQGYESFIQQIKERIRHTQIKAALAVNQELVLLYWDIGQELIILQRGERWGSGVLERISKDLMKTFPDMKGFSVRNMRSIKSFAESYPDREFVKQVVSQIPWGHNVRLLQLVKSPEERAWYIHKTVQNGWSRDILVHQIETNLYKRSGSAPSNFARTLPPPQSDLAHQILKDPYNFDFLTLTSSAQEREIERGLTDHIKEFLLELGVGFAFLGSQYNIVVDDRDYYIDLLFYHVRLYCYVVIELKATDFEPEYAGKMNFYLAAVDKQVRQPHDNPSIGIILCRSKSKVVAEYALSDYNKPIGISTYQLTEALPEKFQSSLPTIEQLEAELKFDEEDKEKVDVGN